jgi:hypothetical protein
VRLLSLLPRIQEKGILIDARAVAHDLKSMWNFQQNLQIHPNFRRVYPGGWTKSTEQGEIVFNLAFNYFPQGAPEGAQGPTPQEAGLPDFVEAPGTDATARTPRTRTTSRPRSLRPRPRSRPRRAAGSALGPRRRRRAAVGPLELRRRPAGAAGGSRRANRKDAIPGTARGLRNARAIRRAAPPPPRANPSAGD